MFGKEGNPFKVVAFLLVVLLSPIVFVGLSTRVAFMEWFIEWEYSKEDFPKDRYGLDDEYRKYLAKLGLRAVLSDEGMEEFKRATLPDGRLAFNRREVKHMEDVKNLLEVAFPAVYASALLWVLSLFVLRKPRLVGNALVAGSFFSLLLAGGIGLFSYLNYDLAFELFHNYVFDPYSWRFRYTDTLLRIYPMKFWKDGTFFVVGTSLFLCALSLIAGLYLRLKTR